MRSWLLADLLLDPAPLSRLRVDLWKKYIAILLAKTISRYLLMVMMIMVMKAKLLLIQDDGDDKDGR